MVRLTTAVPEEESSEVDMDMRTDTEGELGRRVAWGGRFEPVNRLKTTSTITASATSTLTSGSRPAHVAGEGEGERDSGIEVTREVHSFYSSSAAAATTTATTTAAINDDVCDGESNAATSIPMNKDSHSNTNANANYNDSTISATPGQMQIDAPLLQSTISVPVPRPSTATAINPEQLFLFRPRDYLLDFMLAVMSAASTSCYLYILVVFESPFIYGVVSVCTLILTFVPMTVLALNLLKPR
jgi:hypothetical protein